LQGFDLELSVIMRRKGAFSLNLVNSPIRAALHLAKFDKLSVEPRGAMLAAAFE
jgi:hypothetical protein